MALNKNNPVDITIRRAHPDDTQSVLPLIYSSGPHEFDYVLNVGNKTTWDYLSFVFPSRLGRQSHRVHWVAELEHRIVGVGGFYSGRDSPRLNLEDAWNALRFYGLKDATKVAKRSAKMESIIPPIAPDAGFICQLGVRKELRGSGIGTALIQHMIGLARERGLRKCVLDVAMTNPRAQALYERLGFKEVQENRWNNLSSKADVPGQRRMELVLWMG